MKRHRELHMIGNAHLDPVWLWPWSEGLQALRATLHSAVARLRETEAFVFTFSQVAMYEWILRCEPELFADIQQLVADGRWVVTGGWWVEPDCNIPSGESLVRQGLYGQRFLQEHLGITATVGYNIDSFGHSWALPQILRQSGLDYYVFMRPNKEIEKPDLPSPIFHWQGVDGSEVLTYHIPFAYNLAWGTQLEEGINKLKQRLSDNLPLLMCFYGVGNHGGGPTKENLRTIERLAVENEPHGVTIKFSDPDRWFAAVEDSGVTFPVLRDELQHHAVGCYAAHSEIKRNNRRAEHALGHAERLAVAANLVTGADYPLGELTRAWKGLLFTQFHDILAGTSIRQAYDDARHLHGVCFTVADEVSTFALQAIASRIHLPGKGTPVIVWNGHSHRYQGPVALDTLWTDDRVAVFTSEGEVVEYQEVAPSAVVRPGKRMALAFLADVPPMGYTTYWLRPENSVAISGESDPLHVTKTSLENQFARVEFDEDTGSMRRMYWKDRNWDVFSGLSATALVLADHSDTWSHGIFGYHDNPLGRFGQATMHVVEEGPVRASLRVKSTYGRSSLTQRFVMYKGVPYLDVFVSVDWREQQQVLKLAFPVNVVEPTATYETQFATISRPTDGQEEPGLQWLDVSGDRGGFDQGLALFTNGKYSFDVKGSTIHLTVLRSPVYAHHIPRELDPDEAYDYIDQGVQEFAYRLYPHGGDWHHVPVVQLGNEFNAPPMLLVEHNHHGSLPEQRSFWQCDSANVVVSAIKGAEDGDGFVLRAYEAYGQGGTCGFSLVSLGLGWQAHFQPYEVKTFRIGLDSGVQEVTLCEW